MQYRIVKVERDVVYYILRIKKWWGWSTACDHDSIRPMRFGSVKEVENWVLSCYAKPRKSIVKEGCV